MYTSPSGIFAIITGIVLIILVILLYIRSLQGDQRVINTINQMLLPILSAIAITLAIVFANRRPPQSCAGTFDTIRYVGIIVILALVLIGFLRFSLSRNRDRRLITHPLLFTVIILTVVFLVEYLNGCL